MMELRIVHSSAALYAKRMRMLPTFVAATWYTLARLLKAEWTLLVYIGVNDPAAL